MRFNYFYLMVFLFTFLLSGCAKEKVNNIPDEFVDLVLEFIDEGERRGVSLNYEDLGLTISLEENLDDPPLLGYCKSRKNSKTVVISREFWESRNISFESKKSLLFHELGHCLLGREHRSDTIIANICSSIMKPGTADCVEILGSRIWWDYYLDELFEFTRHENFLNMLLSDTSSVIADALPVLYRIDTLVDYLHFEAPISKQDLGDTFVIGIRFDNWKAFANTAIIEVMGYRLHYCDCIVNSFKLKGRNNIEHYTSKDRFEEGHIEFKIVSINENLKFYLNEKYLLTMEDASNEHLLEFKTNRFSSLVNAKIEIKTN